MIGGTGIKSSTTQFSYGAETLPICIGNDIQIVYRSITHAQTLICNTQTQMICPLCQPL